MKKIILPLALIFGAIALHAQSTPDTVAKENALPLVELQAQEPAAPADAYVEVKADELSAPVKESIQKNFTEYTVKTAFFNAAQKLSKIVLVAKADNSEKTVIINEEGKIQA